MANLAEERIVCNLGGSRAPVLSGDAQLRGNMIFESKIGALVFAFPMWKSGTGGDGKTPGS